MATAPSANDLTRQQLDELDALLQRMLALPLNGPDAASPALDDVPPVPNWRVDPPAVPVSAPTPPYRPDPPRPRPVEPDAQMPPANPFAHAATPSEALAAPVSKMPPPEPAVPVGDLKSALLAKATTPNISVPPPPAPPPPPETVPVVLWPLVAFNWAVDVVLGLLGPPGRLARSGFGKNLLGLAGVLLLVYTAAHAARVQGWVSLPFPLPWPR